MLEVLKRSWLHCSYHFSRSAVYLWEVERLLVSGVMVDLLKVLDLVNLAVSPVLHFVVPHLVWVNELGRRIGIVELPMHGHILAID